MERDVITDESGRFVCTASQPWIGAALQKKYPRVVHPEGVDDGSCSEGCCDDYHCKVCDTRWREENAQ
jgi:hypothetical protein